MSDPKDNPFSQRPTLTPKGGEDSEPENDEKAAEPPPSASTAVPPPERMMAERTPTEIPGEDGEPDTPSSNPVHRIDSQDERFVTLAEMKYDEEIVAPPTNLIRPGIKRDPEVEARFDVVHENTPLSREEKKQLQAPTPEPEPAAAPPPPAMEDDEEREGTLRSAAFGESDTIAVLEAVRRATSPPPVSPIPPPPDPPPQLRVVKKIPKEHENPWWTGGDYEEGMEELSEEDDSSDRDPTGRMKPKVSQSDEGEGEAQNLPKPDEQLEPGEDDMAQTSGVRGLVAIGAVLLFTGAVICAGIGLYLMSTGEDVLAAVIPPEVTSPETVETTPEPTPPTPEPPVPEPTKAVETKAPVVEPAKVDPPPLPPAAEKPEPGIDGFEDRGKKYSEPAPPPPSPKPKASGEPTKATFTVGAPYGNGSSACVAGVLRGVEVTKAGREDLTICGPGVTAKGDTIIIGTDKLTVGDLVDGMRVQQGAAVQDYVIMGATVHCKGGSTFNAQPTCTLK